MMDADGFERAVDVRRDLPRRDRRSEGSGSHRGLGSAPAASAAVPAVRQPSSDAAASRPERRRSPIAGRPTSTWCASARTPRASTRDWAGGYTSARRSKSAEQTGLFTRTGIERILRYGFEIASKRPRKLLASATKSNALRHSMVFWDEVAEVVRKDYPAVEYRKYHVDAIAARMVTHPASLDVIVVLESLRRHPHRHRLGHLGQPGHRAGREHQPGTDVTVDVRADPRLGTGYRRQRDRQPDRLHLGRRDDARPSRPSATCTTRSSPRSNASSRQGRTGRLISGGRRRRRTSLTRSRPRSKRATKTRK